MSDKHYYTYEYLPGPVVDEEDENEVTLNYPAGSGDPFKDGSNNEIGFVQFDLGGNFTTGKIYLNWYNGHEPDAPEFSSDIDVDIDRDEPNDRFICTFTRPDSGDPDSTWSAVVTTPGHPLHVKIKRLT